MKKSHFITMLLAIVGVLILGIGMCMCMLPEWNAFRPGVTIGCIGLVELLITVFVYRRMEHMAPIKWNLKTVGAVLLAIIGALTLGVGMCFAMVWQMFVVGIVVGIIGIVLLLMLIPICVGIK